MNFRRATTIAILAAAAACRPSEQRAAGGDTAAAGTQAAPAAAAAAEPEPPPASPKPTEGWKLVSTARGFDSPESVWYDSTLDVYFVSNTGSGDDDSHGFISRLRSDGSIDSLRFIADGRDGATLHTPRGLTVLGDTLWVADGKTLRGFDKRSGKSVGEVDFSQLEAELLNDVAVGPDGSVFITDTRARDGAGEIFRVPQLTVEGRSRNPQRAGSSNANFEGPNGITWDRVGGRYLIASFLGNHVYSWMPGAEPKLVATGPGRFDGIAALGDGRILVTSWNDSSLMVVRRDSMLTVIGGLPEPADIGIDSRRQRVAIPLSASNEVAIFTIPPATAGREVPKRVTR